MTETLHQQVRVSVFTFTLLDCSAAGSLFKLNQIGQRNVNTTCQVKSCILGKLPSVFFFFYLREKWAQLQLPGVSLQGHVQTDISTAPRNTNLFSMKPRNLMQHHAIVTPAIWHHNGTRALFRTGTIILPQSCDHRWTSPSAGGNTPKMHFGHIWTVISQTTSGDGHIPSAVCSSMCPGQHRWTASSTDLLCF